MILPLLLLSSPTQCFLTWIFLFLLLTSLVKKIPLSGSIHSVPITKNHYFKEWKRLQTQHSRTSFIHSRKICSKTINNAKSFFVQRINNKIASCQAGSRSFWSIAKVASQNFCLSSFPALKTTLILLKQPLHPRPIFSRQSLPPIPTWTTKGSNHVISPFQNSLCHPLSSRHEKFAKPFSSLTPPNPKALMVFQQ